MKINYLIITIVLLVSLESFSQKGYGSDLSATIAIPTGPSSEYFKTGYGAIGGFYYELESDWRVGLTLGFIRFGVNSDEVNNYFKTLGQDADLELSGSISSIPILLSFKYLTKGSSARFYIIFEGGLYTYWSKAEGNIFYTNGDIVPVDKSEFSSEIGFDLGFGILFPVSEDISLDASVRYHFVRNSETIKVDYYTGEESVGASHFINIGVGANWNFGF